MCLKITFHTNLFHILKLSLCTIATRSVLPTSVIPDVSMNLDMNAMTHYIIVKYPSEWMRVLVHVSLDRKWSRLVWGQWQKRMVTMLLLWLRLVTDWFWGSWYAADAASHRHAIQPCFSAAYVLLIICFVNYSRCYIFFFPFLPLSLLHSHCIPQHSNTGLVASI